MIIQQNILMEDYMNSKEIKELFDEIMIKGKLVIKTKEQFAKYNAFLKRMREYVNDERTE